ncbi:MAG: hypothetical protein WAS93_02930 [Burkholderiaceae bacterium]
MTHLPPSTSVLYLQATDERFFDALWANATAQERQQYAFLRTLQQANCQHRAQILSEQPIHTADVCYTLAQRGLSADLGLAPWLAAHAGVTAAQQDMAQTSATTWLRLTPVHWAAARDHVNVHRFYGDMMAAQDHADWHAIWLDLVPWLDEMSWTLFPIESNVTVYARTPQGFDYCAPSLDYAQSDMLEAFLPNGSDLKRWQKLLTELQMLLHAHPVNATRAQRGARPINSLWLDQVAPASAMPHDAPNSAPPKQSSLPMLTFAHSLTDIAAQLQPLATQIQQGQTATLTVLADTLNETPMAVAHHFTFTPPTLWQKIRTQLNKQSADAHPFGWLKPCCESHEAQP